MYRFAYTDNQQMSSSTFVDDGHVSVTDASRVERALREISAKTLGQLDSQYPGLLVVPPDFDTIPDRIKDQHLFQMSYGGSIATENLVGWFGIRGADSVFSIRSRFDVEEHQYFFCYLLERVLGAHVINLPTVSSDEALLSFSAYLFPFALKAALSKGLLRSYCMERENSSVLRGSIDLSRHLQLNQPFRGKVAQITRSRSEDNDVNQLVRHTIEFLAKSDRRAVLSIDPDVAQAVATIRAATPTYSRGERTRVIGRNLRQIKHPYYQEYTYLQKVCLQVLRHESVAMNASADHEILGAVFDIAWLWEEYVWTLLSRFPRGNMRHPRNRTRTGAIPFLTGGLITGSMYPDFQWNRGAVVGHQCEAVLDAKYKRLVNGGRVSVGAQDLAELARYALTLQPEKCVYLSLEAEDGQGLSARVYGLGRVNNDDPNASHFHVVSFVVPEATSSDDYSSFTSKMVQSEQSFMAELSALLT